MYLEISARQTGKTMRMIHQIQYDKREYDVQILMGMNLVSLKHIKKLIKENNKVKICLSYTSLKDLIETHKNKKIRLYVDEFMFNTAFCNNFENILALYPSIINNGYFSSSINTRFSNVSMELLRLNNNRYLTCTHSISHIC